MLGKVIGPWQTCALQWRKITDNLILLRDIISYVGKNQRPLVVESLDLEKAYDKSVTRLHAPGDGKVGNSGKPTKGNVMFL